MILAKLRNIDSYNIMSWEQTENIFTTPSSPKPTPKHEPRS